jgi:DNA-binding response OmpR family regulator
VDYIVKPFYFKEVVARVETHLALSNLQVQLEQANLALAARVAELTDFRKKTGGKGEKVERLCVCTPQRILHHG